MEEDKKVAGKKVMSCTADDLDAEGHIDRSQQGGLVADEVCGRPMTEEASTCHSGCHI